MSSKKELQKKLLEIVKYFDELCQKNDIEYYLIYGSALGAIRHKGFIPWDDDLDVGMTYENYLKLIKVCEEQLDKDKYYLQYDEKETNYYLSFMKLRDITTTLIEEGNKDIDIIRGAYIDIFPLVGVPKNKLKKEILKLNRVLAISCNSSVISNKALDFIFKIIKFIVGKKRLLKITRKNCVKYSTDTCTEWLSVFDGDSFSRNCTTKEIMGKPIRVKFEDTTLPVPAKTHEYLTNCYGDYLKIPSKEQIKASEHTPFYINLNLPYQDYLKKYQRSDFI